MRFIGLPAFFVLILGIVALVRGHLSWARITNRKTAGIVTAVAGVVFLVAVAIDPGTTSSPPVAAPAPAVTTTSTTPATTTATTTVAPPPTTTSEAPAPTTVASVTTTVAPPPTTTVPLSPPSTTTADAPPVDNPSPADVAKQVHASCLQFESSVVPVIRSNVGADDLAPIIRLHMGILPDSTTGANDPNPPYLQVSTEFGSEALDDPGFQPIYDAMNGLTNAIIRADPSGDLHEIDSAVNTVTHQCEALHALP